jgi:hypothetical protein
MGNTLFVREQLVRSAGRLDTVFDGALRIPYGGGLKEVMCELGKMGILTSTVRCAAPP